MWRRRVLTGCAALGLALVAAVPAGAMLVVGTDGDDVLTGTRGSDRINALAGNDVVYARAGDDTVVGGGGDDELHLGPGQDATYGSSYLMCSDTSVAGSDEVYSGRDSDAVVLIRGHDSAFTGPGDDGVWLFPPVSATVHMGAGNDAVRADDLTVDGPYCGHSSGSTTVGRFMVDAAGGPGRDSLGHRAILAFWGGWEDYAPRVTLRGGGGRDSIGLSGTFPSGIYKVIAGESGDSIDTEGYTRVLAGRGDDQVIVSGRDNVVDCGPGTDKVIIMRARDSAWPPQLRRTVTPTTIGCERIIDQR
jgi:Ca2+-binding RTX toxin-like protein